MSMTDVAGDVCGHDWPVLAFHRRSHILHLAVSVRLGRGISMVELVRRDDQRHGQEAARPPTLFFLVGAPSLSISVLPSPVVLLPPPPTEKRRTTRQIQM